MRAQIGEESVIQANAQFWEQMLAMTVEPIPGPREFHAAAGHLVGSVGLSGVWTGRIEVRLDGSLAREATAAMLMQPAEEVGEADTVDATKEIANMIAGVIKSCLPRPCAMTVPAASVEMEAFTSAAPGDDSLEVVFRHGSGDLMVRVWEQECLQ